MTWERHVTQLSLPMPLPRRSGPTEAKILQTEPWQEVVEVYDEEDQLPDLEMQLGLGDTPSDIEVEESGPATEVRTFDLSCERTRTVLTRISRAIQWRK